MAHPISNIQRFGKHLKMDFSDRANETITHISEENGIYGSLRQHIV